MGEPAESCIVAKKKEKKEKKHIDERMWINGYFWSA